MYKRCMNVALGGPEWQEFFLCGQLKIVGNGPGLISWENSNVVLNTI
jgi:hypothetical protein